MSLIDIEAESIFIVVKGTSLVTVVKGAVVVKIFATGLIISVMNGTGKTTIGMSMIVTSLIDMKGSDMIGKEFMILIGMNVIGHIMIATIQNGVNIVEMNTIGMKATDENVIDMIIIGMSGTDMIWLHTRDRTAIGINVVATVVIDTIVMDTNHMGTGNIQ